MRGPLHIDGVTQNMPLAYSFLECLLLSPVKRLSDICFTCSVRQKPLHPLTPSYDVQHWRRLLGLVVYSKVNWPGLKKGKGRGAEFRLACARETRMPAQSRPAADRHRHRCLGGGSSRQGRDYGKLAHAHFKIISGPSQDTEDLAIQMMLRASDAGSQVRQQVSGAGRTARAFFDSAKAWITYCDPWMKREFADDSAVLQPGSFTQLSLLSCL